MHTSFIYHTSPKILAHRKKSKSRHFHFHRRTETKKKRFNSIGVGSSLIIQYIQREVAQQSKKEYYLYFWTIFNQAAGTMTTRYQKQQQQQQQQQHTVAFSRKSFGSQNADKSITNLFTSLNNEVYKHDVTKLYEGRLRSHARNFEVRF
jgi:hypothetical protein